jgi:hypothetical protein
MAGRIEPQSDRQFDGNYSEKAVAKAKTCKAPKGRALSDTPKAQAPWSAIAGACTPTSPASAGRHHHLVPRKDAENA